MDIGSDGFVIVGIVVFDTLVVGATVDNLLFALSLVFFTAIGTALASVLISVLTSVLTFTVASAVAVAFAVSIGFSLAHAHTR